MQTFISNYDGVKIEWAQRNVRSPNASIGQIRYQPGGYCGPRTQREYELVLLYSGSCDMQLDKRRRVLEIGRVYLLRPGHVERYLFDELNLTHHFWCSVAPSSLPHTLKCSLDTVSDEGLIPSECFSRFVSSAFLVHVGQSSPACHVIDTLAICLFYEFLNMANSALVLARDDTYVIHPFHRDNLSTSTARSPPPKAPCPQREVLFWSAVASGIPCDTAFTKPRKAVPRSSGGCRTLLVTALQKDGDPPSLPETIFPIIPTFQ